MSGRHPAGAFGPVTGLHSQPTPRFPEGLPFRRGASHKGKVPQ